MSCRLRPRFAAVALSVVVFVSVLAPFLVGPAAALVQGEPDISLTVSDNRVSAGETTTIQVNAVNRGELEQGSDQGNVQAEQRVTTARGVTLRARSRGPVTVRSGTAALGSVPDGEARPGTFEITVDEDADPGTYEIPVRVEYKYTSQIAERDTRSVEDDEVDDVRTIRIVVDEDARFEVVGVDAREPGDSGTFALDVENTGEATANDAVVSLTSLSSDVQFGEGEASRTFVEAWTPGERRTLLFRGSVNENAPTSDLPVSLSVEYTDNDSIAFTSESTFGLTPEADQSFSYESRGATLRVSEEGTVRGTVVNEGPNEVRNAVVTLEPPGRNVEVLEPEVALGDLEPGEEVDVAFDIEVSSTGRAGPRQFSLSTDYETMDGDERSADTIRFREDVEPQRDVFGVEATERTVTADGTERVTLSVTNNKEETVTDVSAKMFASSPLSVADDEAFVDELAPGETVELQFRVSAADGAMTKAYPVSVDFQYVDAAGETRLTDSYRVPVTVEESSGGFFSRFGLTFPAALAAALLVPFVVYRRG